MKICMISKFPPIQGGIAARTYWLARGLAEAGHEITIVTNSASVEKEYKIEGCNEHLQTLKNIRICSISDTTPWHIPNSEEYATRLLNRTLELLRSEQFDVIDAGYLIPYGIVAYLAHKITSVPYIIRHGGSDIGKFMEHPEYKSIVAEAIRCASLIVTDAVYEDLFATCSSNVAIMPSYVPDGDVFTQAHTTPREKPVFAYVGKINYYWQRRGLSQIAEIFEGLSEDQYQLLFIVQGVGFDGFKDSLSKRMREIIDFKPFIPAWEMPTLFRGIDYLLHFMIDEPIPHPSNTVLEALATGAEVVTNYNLSLEGVYRLDLADISSCTSFIEHLIAKRKLKQPQDITTKQQSDFDYQDYLLHNIKLYECAVGI